MNSTVEINKRMIGKDVLILTDGGWKGRIVNVSNCDNFLVLKGKKIVTVNIFDIRSLMMEE